MATMTPKAIVDAKGDLIAATANDTPARLAVGNNGETLVADSSASTGLRYTSGTVQSNPVLNSAFQVWQRGTANVTTASVYTADRWQKSSPTHYGVSRQATGDTTNLPFIQYCARVQRTASSAVTTIVELVQSIESINSVPYAGKTVTFSFYARAGSNYSSTSNAFFSGLYSGTGTDQNLISGFTGQIAVASATSTLTTTWQRFTMTGTVSSSATQLGIYFNYTPTGTAGANDFFEITGIQIDIGSVALPFRTYAGTIQGELAACQRYFEKSYDIATAPGSATGAGSIYLTNGADGSGNSALALRFKVEKRNSSWAIAFYTTGGTVGSWEYARSGVGTTASTAIQDLQSSSGARVYVGTGAGWTVNTINGHWAVTNEL
jgi:hypothetical protein